MQNIILLGENQIRFHRKINQSVLCLGDTRRGSGCAAEREERPAEPLVLGGALPGHPRDRPRPRHLCARGPPRALRLLGSGLKILSFSPNFERLVLRCIDSYDSESRRISAFFEDYKIHNPLHRSDLKISGKSRPIFSLK